VPFLVLNHGRLPRSADFASPPSRWRGPWLNPLRPRSSTVSLASPIPARRRTRADAERGVAGMHHGKLFWHRRLRGKRSRVEVLRLPL
jgi:hypothetical protein